jgi:hypothetical protein
VIALLEELMQADTAGDPTSDKKWSRKDTRSISQEMKARGVPLCPNSAGKLLKHCRYSLRVNRKSIAETQHPDRNRQFELIAEFRKRFEDTDSPVLSMDQEKGTDRQFQECGTNLEERSGTGQPARFS